MYEDGCFGNRRTPSIGPTTCVFPPIVDVHAPDQRHMRSISHDERPSSGVANAGAVRRYPAPRFPSHYAIDRLITPKMADPIVGGREVSNEGQFARRWLAVRPGRRCGVQVSLRHHAADRGRMVERPAPVVFSERVKDEQNVSGGAEGRHGSEDSEKAHQPPPRPRKSSTDRVARVSHPRPANCRFSSRLSTRTTGHSSTK